MAPKDFPVSELRGLTLYFKDDSPLGWHKGATDWMHRDQVPLYIKAKLELHYSPGVNPHVKDRPNQTARLWKITEESFRLEEDDQTNRVLDLSSPKAYWHTTPGLGIGTSDTQIQEEGAHVFMNNSDTLWAHPDSDSVLS